MAKVKRQEVSEQDLFGDVRKSAIETIGDIKVLNKELNETARILEKDLNTALIKDTKSLQTFTKAVKEANRLKKEAASLDKREAVAIEQKHKAQVNSEKLKREQIKTQREEIRNSQILEKQKVAQAKAQGRAAQSARDENNAYKILVKRTRDQKNASKELAATMLSLAAAGKRNSKEYREVATAYRKVTAQAQAGDKALKKIDSTVGDNFRNVGNYNEGLKNLTRSFTRIAGALGLFTALKGVGKIVADFDQAQADLLAISGKTEEQMAGLTAQAKELGATTQFSATQITEMQIELAKLGFETQQIDQSTVAVSNFAAATGADIPQAAALAGSALRGFGLGAEEMERVVSTLGVATTKTALDFNALQSGLSSVAPVANAFGFSIEDTTALLGQLSNAGFDASSAATATRNILLNLADSNGALAKSLGRPITSADDLAAGLQELQASGVDLAEALELTDKRSVAAFETFLKSSDSLVELRDSITDVNTELEDMAAKRLDSISGQFTLMQSAWEGWVLSVNEGSGIGETVKNLIGSLARNFDTVMEVVKQAAKIFLIFKARLIAIKIAASPAGKAMLQFGKSLTSVKKGTGSVASGLKTMGKALKGVGFALAITLALEVAAALWDIFTNAKRVQDAIARMEKAEASADKRAQERITGRAENLKKLISTEERALELSMATAKNEKERTALTKEFLKTKEKLIKSNENQIRSDIKAVTKRREANKAELKEQEDILNKLYGPNARINQTVTKAGNTAKFDAAGRERLKELGVLNSRNQIVIGAFDEIIKKQDQLAGSISGANIKIKQYNDELNTAVEDTKDASTESEVFKKTLVGVRDGASGAGKEIKVINTEFKTQIDLLAELNDQYDRYLEASRSLADLDRSENIAQINAEIEAETALQVAKGKETGKGDASGSLSLIDQRKNLEIEGIQAARDFEIDALEKSNIKRFEQLKTGIDQERAALIEGAEGNKEALIKIEENYQIELTKLKALELDADQVIEAEKIVIKTNANNEILELERKTADEIKDVKKEISDANQEFTDKEIADKKAADDKLAQIEKDAAKRRQELAKLVTDYLIGQSDKRIAAIDKEIKAREDQVDTLKQLAINGNINAQQSIAEEKRLINEANKEKLKEEQRKQRIELAGVAYSTYQSNVEGGSETPLADTIKDISLLQAFINTIPAFESGTENTGANGHGVDGRGGFHAILHPFEKVLNAEDTAKVPAGMSNSELAQVAYDYGTGKITAAGEGAIQIGSPWEGAAVLNKLEGIENAIQNQPQTTYDLEKVTAELFQLTKKTRSGNNLIFNKYRHDA